VLPERPGRREAAVGRAGTKIDEVFIGSCMTNIGHFRAASTLLEGKRDIPVKLWVAPPTKMDAEQLTKEGHYANFGGAGARTEMPGCSLCMGNQAQVKEGATVVSTSPATSRTAWARTPTCSWQRGTGGDRLQAGPHPDRSPSTTPTWA
jgi:aconitate hydratase 2/2-methylisocitrate dehydratase